MWRLKKRPSGKFHPAGGYKNLIPWEVIKIPSRGSYGNFIPWEVTEISFRGKLQKFHPAGRYRNFIPWDATEILSRLQCGNKDFSITQILCEINFGFLGYLEEHNLLFFTHLEALNFDFLCIFALFES